MPILSSGKASVIFFQFTCIYRKFPSCQNKYHKKGCQLVHSDFSFAKVLHIVESKAMCGLSFVSNIIPIKSLLINFILSSRLSFHPEETPASWCAFPILIRKGTFFNILFNCTSMKVLTIHSLCY